jgi:hypothetical protein
MLGSAFCKTGVYYFLQEPVIFEPVCPTIQDFHRLENLLIFWKETERLLHDTCLVLEPSLLL